jgi:hypothetical protein
MPNVGKSVLLVLNKVPRRRKLKKFYKMTQMRKVMKIYKLESVREVDKKDLAAKAANVHFQL